ncbi:MAG: Hpt domain-containing protein [Oligoflexia bacterium]|nr:Hpt domain-containing protein [Oligoflexia bacterium]
MSFDINKDLQASHNLIALLEKAKNFSEITIDSLPIVFTVINQDGLILRANECLAKIFKKNREKLLRENLSKIFEKETWNIFVNKFNKILEPGNTSVEFELDVLGGEGADSIKESYYWYVTPFGKFYSSEGHAYVVLGQNITKLRESEKQISEIFSSISLAILTINPDKLISPKYSIYAEHIFGSSEIGGQNYKNFIFSSGFNYLKKNSQEAIEKLDLIFGESELMFDAIKDNLPKQIIYKRKTLEGEEKLYLGINYQPIIYNGVIKRLLLIIEDRTSLVKAEEENKKIKIFDDRVVQRVVQIRSAKADMMDILIPEVDKLIIKANDSIQKNNWKNFAGVLHSIKGNSRVVGLITMAELSHQAEEKLLFNIEAGIDDFTSSKESFIAIENEWNEIKILYKTFREKSSEPTEGISKNEKNNLEEIQVLFEQYNASIVSGQTVKTAVLSEKINVKLQKINDIELSTIRPLLLERVEQTASKLSKNIITEFECADIKVNKELMDLISDVTLHLINNSIGHGIESVEKRLQKGKTAEGKIKISIKEYRDMLELSVSDDGSGIDINKIKNKIVKKNMVKLDEALTLSEDKLLKYIFSPGFSTAEQVDDIKGRGIGLDTVASRVNDFEGTIDIKTQEGQGAAFIIKIPCANKKNVLRKLFSLKSIKANLVEMLQLMEKEDNLEVNYSYLQADISRDMGVVFVDRAKILLSLINYIVAIEEKFKNVIVSWGGVDAGLISVNIKHEGKKETPGNSKSELKYAIPMEVSDQYICNHGGNVATSDHQTTIFFGFCLDKHVFPKITYSCDEEISDSEKEDLHHFMLQIKDEFDIEIEFAKDSRGGASDDTSILFVKNKDSSSGDLKYENSGFKNTCLFTDNMLEMKKNILDVLQKIICIS